MPSGTYYIRFCIFKTECPNPFELYFAELESYSLLMSEIDEKETMPGNLIKPFECVDNTWISADGTINTGAAGTFPASTFFSTGFIEVVPGEIYNVNKGITINGSPLKYAFYDSSKVRVSGGNMSKRIKITSGVKYIRFSVNKEICKNPFDLYFANILDYELRDDLLTWCNGKKINWIGDSIVAYWDFDDIVVRKLNLTPNGYQDQSDYAIAGSSISVPLDSSKISQMNPIVTRYTDMSNDADIIAVSAGTNDFGFAYGTFGDMTSTENTSFYGAMKTLCQGLMTKFPGKVIFFTTPIKRGDTTADFGGPYPTQETTNSLGKTLKDYRDAIIEICAYYGIPVLDLWGESLLNPTFEAGAAFLMMDCTRMNLVEN
jgi:hypothetical protein